MMNPNYPRKPPTNEIRNESGDPGPFLLRRPHCRGNGSVRQSIVTGFSLKISLSPYSDYK